ncbi:MAG TPA: branched-chain amino acid ABC transporter permease [Candidatus Peribacteraceae bacterium]|nr:branched-chain amino acid ABC transporter permease [Candidatus Peribacteraceae bacterium]
MQLLLNGLIAGSLAALIAGGLALVYGVLGIFNLALGQLVLIGGYSTWWFHQVAGLPLGPSIVLGLLSGAFVTWITYEIAIRPFFKHHRFLPLVTTIAWSMILDGCILLLFDEQPRSILPGLMTAYEFYGVRISIEHAILIVTTLILLVVFAYVFHSTAIGRRIRAVVHNEHAALSLGIPASTLHLLLFIMSGIFAAAGGIFIGIDQNLAPTLGFGMTIKAYAAIIAGGKGNIWGAIICAYIIAILEQLLVGIPWFGLGYVPAGYQQTVALLFIIAVLLLRPAGLFSSTSRTA